MPHTTSLDANISIDVVAENTPSDERGGRFEDAMMNSARAKYLSVHCQYQFIYGDC